MNALPPAYAHVLSLGILWTSVHCASMCGPLLCGLSIGGASPNFKTGATQGIFGVLRYQAGRSLTYAWLGGLAGLAGAGLGRIFTSAGGVLSLLFGAALIFSVLRTRTTLVKLGRRPSLRVIPAAVAYLRALFSPLLSSPQPMREVALGALLGFLPCMIPAWALGQAALTASPYHGAAIMLLLVLLTTPVLLVATQLPRLFQAFPAGLREKIARVLPMISGCWLMLVGGAGLSLWPHAHLGVSLFGRPFMMMIF